MTLSRRLGTGLLLLATGCGAPAATRTGAADSLIQAGETLFGAEQYDSARATFAGAVEHARQADDQVGEARALTGLGAVERELTLLDSATTHVERAIERWRQAGRPAEAGPAWNVLGLIRLDQNRDQEAIRAFERATDAARAAGDSVTLAKSSGNAGLAYSYQGDFTRARMAFRGLREAGRARGNALWEGNGLTNEAMIDVQSGDPAPAIARLDTARRLYRRIAYQKGEQVALGQLAAAWQLTGNYGAAFAALDTALRLARGDGLRYEEAVNIRMIADLHARVGDYRRAIDQYTEAEAILRETGATADLSAALRGAAESYARLGNTVRAAEAAAEALRIDRESGEQPYELHDLVLLAVLEAANASDAAMGARLAEIRRLADTIGTRGALGAALLAEAQVADIRRRPATAARAAREVASLLPGDDATLTQAYGIEARAHAAGGQLEQAVSAGRLAVAAIERLRGSLRSEPPAATLVASQADVYGDLVLALLRLGRNAEAFAVADHGRSRSLLDNLAAVRSGAGAARDLAAGDSLLAAIDRLVQQLRASPARPDQRGGLLLAGAQGLEARLAGARANYEAVLIRAARQDAKALALLGADEPASLESVRSALAPRQALIEYFIGARLVIFVVTPDGLTVFDRPLDRSALLQRVRLLRDLWGTPVPDWRTALPTARALHRELIAPAEARGALAGVEELYLVPHGILEAVPFAALQDEAGRYLVERYATARLPSARALTVLGGDRAAQSPMGAAAFAPFPETLPASRAEALAVGARLGGTSVALGDGATEASVRAALERGAMVHVASHGVLNVRNPMFSRLELARGGAPGSETDGRLEVHEILGMAVRSPFVFFSGCETGAFREWTQDPLLGSGETGLAQAVLAAGARDVVSTLWRIDDSGAAAFADGFYRRFGRGGAMEALAGAQRALALDGPYRSPYYWAGYTLSGQGGSRPQIEPANP